MIGRLRGVLTSKSPPWLVIDVNGVGYELEAPMSTIYELPDIGCEVTLFTHLTHKDEYIFLYGFLKENERHLFRDMQRVSGIGAKTALAVLSSIGVHAFTELLRDNDVAGLTRVPGIGKKTAERIILELKDRVGGADAALSARYQAGTSIADRPAAEALAALQQLGFKPAEAGRMIRAVHQETDTVTEIIRKALQTTL